MASKEELLAAIAAAGTQGKVDYEAAQVANKNAQAEAIRMALASGVAQSAGIGAQGELSRIIGQPYAVSNTRLAANDAAQETWFNHAKWNEGEFQGNLDKLRDALIAQALAEAASGGGSGGGGGGGSSKEDDPYDWQSALKDAYGSTEKLRRAGIAADAESLVAESGAPRAIGVQQVADEFQIPDYALDTMFQGPKFIREGLAGIEEFAASGKTRKEYKQASKREGKRIPGNQSNMRKYLQKQANLTLPKRRKRRKNRG